MALCKKIAICGLLRIGNRGVHTILRSIHLCDGELCGARMIGVGRTVLENALRQRQRLIERITDVLFAKIGDRILKTFQIIDHCVRRSPIAVRHFLNGTFAVLRAADVHLCSPAACESIRFAALRRPPRRPPTNERRIRPK